MAWFHLSTWLPCLFCGEARGTQHRLCTDCWQQIPWDQTPQQRQDVQFTASCFYQYPMNRVIHQFKDQAQLHYLNLLTACLLQLPKPRVHAIVPMPLATEKLIQRGFSQTHLLAKALSKHWQLPIWQPIARTSGDNQRGLDRAQRLSNVSNQLYLAQNTQQSYQKILMLDDVITTGASLFALQEQLKLLGCTDIQAFCICNA